MHVHCISNCRFSTMGFWAWRVRILSLQLLIQCLWAWRVLFFMPGCSHYLVHREVCLHWQLDKNVIEYYPIAKTAQSSKCFCNYPYLLCLLYTLRRKSFIKCGNSRRGHINIIIKKKCNLTLAMSPLCQSNRSLSVTTGIIYFYSYDFFSNQIFGQV